MLVVKHQFHKLDDDNNKLYLEVFGVFLKDTSVGQVPAAVWVQGFN